MSDHTHDHSHSSAGAPRWALASAAGVVVFALIIVAGARLSGMKPVSAPSATAAAEATLAVRFIDREDGAIVVREGETDAVLAVLNDNTTALVRGVAQTLDHARRVHLARDGGADAARLADPLVLTRFANGLIWLEDPHSGKRIELRAFGVDSLAVFAALFEADPAADAPPAETAGVDDVAQAATAPHAAEQEAS